MSPAESILYENKSEVHPGAGPVKLFLAGHGNSRYLYKMHIGFAVRYANRVEPRISPPLYYGGGVFLYP
jgi:hypothetical protein